MTIINPVKDIKKELRTIKLSLIIEISKSIIVKYKEFLKINKLNTINNTKAIIYSQLRKHILRHQHNSFYLTRLLKIWHKQLFTCNKLFYFKLQTFEY